MIDLHTHSTVSDGTDPPAEVVRQAARAGLSTVALTDHDTTAGWPKAVQAAREEGIALVRGAELSTVHEGRSVHLLAYLFDPEHEGLSSEMALVVDDRLPRLRRMTELMAEDGIDITWQDVAARLGPGVTPGRPHLADALVAKGVVPDRSAAFADWLRNDSRYYVRHHALRTTDAIDLVGAAGGVPVVAHPFALRRSRGLTPPLVRDLAERGLAGIEVDHRDHDDDARATARALAADLDLIATGSSDFHGDGKPNRLGEHTTAPESLARIEELARSDVAVVR